MKYILYEEKKTNLFMVQKVYFPNEWIYEVFLKTGFLKLAIIEFIHLKYMNGSSLAVTQNFVYEELYSNSAATSRINFVRSILQAFVSDIFNVINILILQ